MEIKKRLIDRIMKNYDDLDTEEAHIENDKLLLEYINIRYSRGLYSMIVVGMNAFDKCCVT